MGHYDIVDKRDGTIIEVKTAHTTKVLKEAYPYHYQQLAMYLSITGAKKFAKLKKYWFAFLI